MTEDSKTCCDWSKVIRRVHCGVITKLMKKVDELLSSESISEEMQAGLSKCDILTIRSEAINI